jgi:SAM-dependent methyltransferase
MAMDIQAVHAASKLNLGSGTKILAGYVNLDRVALPGVDVVHDLNDLPLPFTDEQFNEVLANDVLEHVDLVQVMRELHRILKPGGKLIARVPHFSSPAAYGDPTHVRAFGIGTFEFFTRVSPQAHYFDFAFDRIERLRLTFARLRSMPWNSLVERFINRSPWMLGIYEGSFLRGLFPADSIEVVMRK